MKVQHPDDSTNPNPANIYKIYNNLSYHLWNCDNEKWDGNCRMRQLTLSSTPWLYRGEGNANLVISLPKEKVIVRLQKFEYDIKITSALLEEREKKLIRDIEFFRKVMISFLGSSFFQPPILARINEKEVAQIDQKLFSIRPRYRLTKGVRCGLVTLHPDYTHLPPVSQKSNILNESHLLTSQNTYCIEIKPKQGWIPLPDRKHPKCSFCMNQYLKVMKKRVTGLSQYCPLDLFSGNIMRMKRAIRNLLITPQNNLKIFKNGNLIFSEDSNRSYQEILRDFFLEDYEKESNIEKLIDRWCSLVVTGLCTRLPEIHAFKSKTILSKEVDSKTELIDNKGWLQHQNSVNQLLLGHLKPCDWTSQPLPNKSILEKILMVQKLQNSNFATVCSLYSERCSSEDDYHYIDSLLETDGPLDTIQRYLLSTTAKDCSIFLALQATIKTDSPYKTHFIQDSEGVNYRLNIGISDIDPKPLSCIGKHVKRDEEILEAVIKNVKHLTPA